MLKKIDLIFHIFIKSIITMDSITNTNSHRNNFEKFIIDMKETNENNIDDIIKEVTGDSKEMLQILKIINSIVDCKNMMENTN